MSLVGPDGRPLQTSPNEQVMMALRQLHDRQNALFQRMLYLDILTGYLAEQLEANKILDMKNWPEFAERKYQEIQNQVASALREQGRVIHEEDVPADDLAEIAGIDLDDE